MTRQKAVTDTAQPSTGRPVRPFSAAAPTHPNRQSCCAAKCKLGCSCHCLSLRKWGGAPPPTRFRNTPSRRGLSPPSAGPSLVLDGLTAARFHESHGAAVRGSRRKKGALVAFSNSVVGGGFCTALAMMAMPAVLAGMSVEAVATLATCLVGFVVFVYLRWLSSSIDETTTLERSVQERIDRMNARGGGVGFDAALDTPSEDFKSLKEHTGCPFARHALVMNGAKWDPALSLEDNMKRNKDLLLLFNKRVSEGVPLDGFVIEIPDRAYGEPRTSALHIRPSRKVTHPLRSLSGSLCRHCPSRAHRHLGGRSSARPRA